MTSRTTFFPASPSIKMDCHILRASLTRGFANSFPASIPVLPDFLSNSFAWLCPGTRSAINGGADLASAVKATDNTPRNPCEQRDRRRERPPSERCERLAVSSELVEHQLQRVWRPLNEMRTHKDGVGLLLKTSRSSVGMEEKWMRSICVQMKKKGLSTGPTKVSRGARYLSVSTLVLLTHGIWESVSTLCML